MKHLENKKTEDSWSNSKNLENSRVYIKRIRKNLENLKNSEIQKSPKVQKSEISWKKLEEMESINKPFQLFIKIITG